MLTRRLTERDTRARYRTMVWSAYFWCSPIRFQSAASLIRCKLLVRRSMGFPIGASFLRLVVGTSPVARPPWVGGFLLAARSHDASTVSEPNLLDVVSVVPMTRGFSPPASGLATVCQPPEALEANKAKSCAVFLDWLADGDHISQRPLLQPLLHE